MKKNILILLILILIPMTTFAWEDCPYGEVNDPAPGKCGRYTDTDHDQICDLSQPTPEDRIINPLDTKTTKINELTLNLTNNKKEMTYHFIPITLILVILYALSRLLLKKGVINLITHRRIWNIPLLITFLISGILGILLIIRINFGLSSPAKFNALFWHVEIGIIMFDICIFHIIERWYFFKNIFKGKE
jgi:hypothetical protein